jgi:hypothetical protein
MTNCNFIDNQIGLSFAANVFDSMYVADCQFLNNEVGINYPNNGTVQNCLFSNNTTGVQSAYNCEIFNNEFSINELALEASVNADIHNNQINNNKGGLLISNISSVLDSLLIYNNEICSNLNYNVNNNTNFNYSLLSNCFCDLDSAEIEELLIDGYDDITKGLINYQIYDSSCTVLLGTVLKYGAGAGIDEASLDLTFENPVGSDFLVFAGIDIQSIEITDLSGKQFSFASSGANHFDVSQLPAGFYVLSAVNEQMVRRSFVKM